MGRNSHFRTVMTRFSDTASQQLEESLEWKRRAFKLRFFDACSTYRFELAWKAARKKGTTRWMCETEQYKEWKGQKEDSTFWCSGILGSGKTVITANIVEDLTVDPTVGIVAYFFCEYDNVESLQARTVLGSLVRQVYEGLKLDIPKEIVFKENTKLDTDQLIECLEKLPSSVSRVHLVIDGLDECEEKETKVLLKCLETLKTLNNAFLILYSSRSDILH